MSQQNLNKWPESDDIRNLDNIITTFIPEESVQKYKDELDNIELPTDEYGNKTKVYNLFKMEMALVLYLCKIHIFLKKYSKLLLTHQTRVLQVYMMIL